MKNIVDFTSKIKEKFTMRKDIAPVEESSTASRAYSAGDKFYYGNLLQKAITDIAQGAAFVGGTNFENADPVTTTIQNLSNQVKNNINNNGCKNLFNFDDATYYYPGSSLAFAYGDNCLQITTGGSAGGKEFYYPRYFNIYDSLVKPNTEYVFSCGSSGISGLRLQVYYKPVGGEWTLLESQESVKSLRITTPAAFDAIWFRFNIPTNGTVATGTIYPMLCLASDYDLDPTFVPYAMTNQQLTKETTGLIDNTTQLGCVNLLNHEATAQTDSAGEVTWVINSDGTITATVNKTTTQDRIIHLLSTTNLNALLSKYGTIKITGSPNSRAYIYTKMSNNQYYSDAGAGLVLSGTALQDLRLAIASGTTAQTFTIKPMISLASMNLSYNDYVPYSKSNRELTEEQPTSWINISSNSGAAGTEISIPQLIGYDSILVACYQKNASGYQYRTVNILENSNADNVMSAANQGNGYVAYRMARWNSTTGKLKLIGNGKCYIPGGTSESDDLYCFPYQVKGLTKN